MSDRFVSPCPPPTRAEAELLVCLIEECAEVAQRATKMLRFGVRQTEPGQPFNNVDRLTTEVGDLSAVLARCSEAGLINEPGIVPAALAKDEKLDRFLQHQSARAAQ